MFRHRDVVHDIAFSPDGTLLASASRDQSAKLWDLSTGLEVQHFRESDIVRSVAFSPDGKLLAVAGHAFQVNIYKLFAD